MKENLDTVTVHDLEVLCAVGVPDEERARPQRLLITVEMRLDCAAAAAADDIRRTVDYFAVSRRLLTFGEGRSWKLIETLAADIARCLVSEYPIEAATVEVKKFIIPEARYVSVRMTRSGEPDGNVT